MRLKEGDFVRHRFMLLGVGMVVRGYGNLTSVAVKWENHKHNPTAPIPARVQGEEYAWLYFVEDLVLISGLERAIKKAKGEEYVNQKE
jgi:hypothetical protein